MFSISIRFLLLMVAFVALAIAAKPAQAQFAGDAIEPAELAAAQKVAEGFLAAMRQGQLHQAERLVSATARDELASTFVTDSKAARAAPPIAFKFAMPKKIQSFEPVEYEIELVYAAKANGKWTTALVRVYRYDDDPYRVEYWKVDNRTPSIAAMSDDPVLRQLPGIMQWALLGIGAAGIGLVLFVIWLVRRKPHIISPDTEAERRLAAITTRENDTGD